MSLSARPTSRAHARRAGHLGERARLAIMLALSVLGMSAAGASAADDTPTAYSEAHRFGGFDAAYYNGGSYDGNGGVPVAGKFLNPTVFAVDAEDPDAPDHTAVYVVDRVSQPESGTPTRYRLQKLDESGAVLGVATFTLPGAALGDLPETASLAVQSGSAGALGACCCCSTVRMGPKCVGWSRGRPRSAAASSPHPPGCRSTPSRRRPMGRTLRVSWPRPRS